MSILEAPHPGLAIRYDGLEPPSLTVKDGARVLGVGRQAINDLVNGKAGISADGAATQQSLRHHPGNPASTATHLQSGAGPERESAIHVLSVTEVRRLNLPRPL